jgi:hypothetical protein
MVRPDKGARIVLDLERAGADEVVYAAWLLAPDAEWRGQARVAVADGTVTFSGWTPAEPPAWIVALAHAFLRTEWRARRDADPEPWPRRIHRWRETR